MNKKDELDNLIEDSLKEEVDDVEISDKEIEFEWRKFQKLQRERNQKKSNECKKFICLLASLACICFTIIDSAPSNKPISHKSLSQKYNYKESNVIYLS